MKTAGIQRGSREFEELAPYLKAVRDYPPLTRDEEHALALKARKGEVGAKQKLVRHNLAFVVAIARKQRRGTVRLDDLIQEGNVGLMRAVEKFDPHAGTRFSTYAVWWIRAYVGKYLKEARSTVRPQSGTVAQPDLSLDSYIDEDGDVSHLERIEDEGPGPEGGYLSNEGDREVRDALGKVRKRIGELGWDIIHNRLQQDSPKTLEEIGKRWGVSRERVRQVELKTKQFLHRYLESRRVGGDRPDRQRRGSRLAFREIALHRGPLRHAGWAFRLQGSRPRARRLRESRAGEVAAWTESDAGADRAREACRRGAAHSRPRSGRPVRRPGPSSTRRRTEARRIRSDARREADGVARRRPRRGGARGGAGPGRGRGRPRQPRSGTACSPRCAERDRWTLARGDGGADPGSRGPAGALDGVAAAERALAGPR